MPNSISKEITSANMFIYVVSVINEFWLTTYFGIIHKKIRHIKEITYVLCTYIVLFYS